MKHLLLSLALLIMVPVHATAAPVDRSDIEASDEHADAEALFEEAQLDWDAGEYVDALEGFQAVLDHEHGDSFFEEIALTTGELYPTTQLSEDGTNLRFSPDGQYAAYDQEHDGTTHTHIVDVTDEAPEPIDRFEGEAFTFSSDGPSGAYLQREHTDEMAEVEERLHEAREAEDEAAVERYQEELGWLRAVNTQLVARDVTDGSEQPFQHENLVVTDPVYDTDTGRFFVAAMPHEQTDRTHVYAFDTPGDAPERIHDDAPGYRTALQPVRGSEHLIYQMDDSAPFPVANVEGNAGESVARSGETVIYALDARTKTTFDGEDPVASEDGSMMAYTTTAGDSNRVHVRSLDAPEESQNIMSTVEPVASPALSPDGQQLAFNKQSGISWQVYLADVENGSVEQFSRDIQHELFPEFLDDETLLAKMGEFRHRRAHVYDLDSGDFHRVFHNNRVRTVSMEYEWAPSPSGDRVLIRAERDGNTISDEEGVYLTDLMQTISMDELEARISRQLESERTLRRQAEAMYAPIRDAVDEVTDEISLRHLYDYQKALYDFDSKFYTEPGNQKAGEYIYEKLASFGYEPEYQWFSPDDEHRTANVVARLEGSEHPEGVYVYSAHYDSVPNSPGADDNSTGTAVLLEMARVLADRDLPATIIFASLTAEEAGLLGAQEFVRRAEEEGLEVAGVINNDMMGWTRHHRLDNTIRFSNYGIRDIQHASSILFSDLITYDSRYYRFTDAHVFFNAYGDVIGGIGSYPILGNPNYHQPTDRLETINHRLVRAVAQSTTGVFKKLTHTPSKIDGVEVETAGSGYTVRWDEPLESDINHYQVRYYRPNGDTVTRETSSRSVEIERVDTDRPVAVRAVNERGMEGWDWAEVSLAE